MPPALSMARTTFRTGPFGNFDTMKYRRFPGGSLRVISARAPRNLRSHSARVLIVDEADACEITAEGNPIMLAEKRTLSFDNRKIIIGSTPTDTTTSIVHNSYENSDKRVFECPCPSCGAFCEIRWRDIRWPEGRPSEAEWCCPSCGVFHGEERKPAMVEAGRWRATAPESRRRSSGQCPYRCDARRRVRIPQALVAGARARLPTSPRGRGEVRYGKSSPPNA